MLLVAGGGRSLALWESHSSGREAVADAGAGLGWLCAGSRQWTVERSHSPLSSPPLAHAFTWPHCLCSGILLGAVTLKTIMHSALKHYSFVFISSPICSYICLMFPGNSLVFWALNPLLLTAHNPEHAFYFWISSAISVGFREEVGYTPVCA